MTIFEHEIEPKPKTENILPGEPGWVPYRGPDEEGCYERRAGVFCSLAKGHGGVHAAHGLGRILATWSQVKR